MGALTWWMLDTSMNPMSERLHLCDARCSRQGINRPQALLKTIQSPSLPNPRKPATSVTCPDPLAFLATEE